MLEYRLTTKDNPFNPFDQFDEWLNYDNEKGYGTSQYLARVTRTTASLSPKEYNSEVRRAIDDIIRLDPFGIYEVVSKEVDDLF